MSKPLSTENKLLYELLTKVLGFAPYGFIDMSQWTEFEEKYFFREGESDGEKYSSNTNRLLSGAAMRETIEEIRKRLEDYLGEQTQ